VLYLRGRLSWVASFPSPTLSMGFVVARVGFLMRPDCLLMRCNQTAVFKAASFGTGIPGEGRIPGKGGVSEFILSLSTLALETVLLALQNQGCIVS
jgi:hypothetical protein